MLEQSEEGESIRWRRKTVSLGISLYEQLEGTKLFNFLEVFNKYSAVCWNPVTGSFWAVKIRQEEFDYRSEKV